MGRLDDTGGLPRPDRQYDRPDTGASVTGSIAGTHQADPALPATKHPDYPVPHDHVVDRKRQNLNRITAAHGPIVAVAPVRQA